MPNEIWEMCEMRELFSVVHTLQRTDSFDDVIFNNTGVKNLFTADSNCSSLSAVPSRNSTRSNNSDRENKRFSREIVLNDSQITYRMHHECICSVSLKKMASHSTLQRIFTIWKLGKRILYLPISASVDDIFSSYLRFRFVLSGFQSVFIQHTIS